MNYLLDTHAFIWIDSASSKLSSQVRTLVTSSEDVLYLSLASIWEMQIKYQLGKLQLRSPLATIVTDQQRNNHIQLLPIMLSHIYEMSSLPDYHRDPFDRLLVAQAKNEGLILITDDSQIAKYPISIYW